MFNRLLNGLETERSVQNESNAYDKKQSWWQRHLLNITHDQSMTCQV